MECYDCYDIAADLFHLKLNKSHRLNLLNCMPPHPPAPRSKKVKAESSVYLQAYNAISTVAWLCCIWLTVQGDSLWWVRMVQSVAGLEIIHAALGLVKSSVLSNVIQIGSRLWVAWFVVEEEHSVYYRALVVAWGLADICRYLYYLHSGMKWLRYTLFIVLYPIGVTCELLLMKEHLSTVSWMKYVMMLWPFGFMYMFSHMWQQRKKQLK